VGQTRYTKEHEWVRLTSANEVTVGITDFAQSALGDVVFVDLPEVGATLAKGDAFGSVESVKAASSVYAPVAGTVQQVNQAVKDDNSLVNKSADKDGWMIKVRRGKNNTGKCDRNARQAAALQLQEG
jgi:glycine cleavage system H protein